MWFKKNLLQLIIIGVALVFMLLWLKQCNDNKVAQKKLIVAEHNINALQDTLRVTKNKVGETEYNKLAFLTDKLENLEKLNTDLYKTVKNIKGNVSYITNGTVSVVHDTLELETEGSRDGNLVITDFSFDTTYSKGNSRSIKGWTQYDLETESTLAKLTKDSLSMSFSTGIKNLDKGTPTIFLTSNYPNFSVTELQGAILDPNLFNKKTKQKKLGIGLQLGYSPLSYNLSNKKFGIVNQVTLGVGLSYKIF